MRDRCHRRYRPGRSAAAGCFFDVFQEKWGKVMEKLGKIGGK